MKKILDGYVKVPAFEVVEKAKQVIEHLTKANAQIELDFKLAHDKHEREREDRIAACDAYRDSGMAWRDFSKAKIKNTTFDPILFLGFIRVGSTETIHTYDLNRELEKFNYAFWSNFDYFTLESLTPEMVGRFSDYNHPYYPMRQRLHDTEFFEGLVALGEKDIYLGIDDYNKLNAAWAKVDETTELLVG